MPKGIITSHMDSNVAFDFGTITAFGSISVELTDKQLQSVLVAIAADSLAGRPARFSCVVEGKPSATQPVAPAAPTLEPDKELEQMSDLEVRDLYQATLGNPGNKKRKKLVEELRRAGA